MAATLDRPHRSQRPTLGGDGRDDAARPTRATAHAWRRRVLVAVLLVPLLLTGWSYVGALTYPGSASASVRTVDWLRTHGAAGIVDRIEVWHYSHQEPPRTGTPTGPFPPAPDAAQRARAASAPPAERPILHPGVAPTFAGEAAWTPGPVDTAGRITTETTWFRPDPTHPTVVVGALWIDQRATALHLIAGTREPGHGPWPGTAQVPLDQRSTTVAAFNSGFLLRDSGGAFYEAGRRAGTFLAGGASVVIDRSGHATLGAWGRDVGLHRTTYAVRQNLHLIVDHGRPVPGLVSNGHKLWGSRKSQLEYTWRSALGIDGNGNLVYVAGNHLTLTMLADALTQAGSVRAMQLDIHPPTTTANLFLLGADDHRTAPVKLLPGMNRPADRYLAPDQRDFFTVTVR
jgi:hypothetical protein